MITKKSQSSSVLAIEIGLFKKKVARSRKICTMFLGTEVQVHKLRAHIFCYFQNVAPLFFLHGPPTNTNIEKINDKTREK